MNEADIRDRIARLVDAYKKSLRHRPGTGEGQEAEARAENLLVELGTQMIVDFHRIADALEAIAGELKAGRIG